MGTVDDIRKLGKPLGGRIKDCDPCGRMYHPDTLFFRVDCGDASDSDGHKYEMSVNVGGSTPIIRNVKTGKWYCLSWKDIIGLAKANGIDTPQPKPRRAKKRKK